MRMNGTTYADEATIGCGAAKRWLRVDLRFQFGSVGAFLELGYCLRPDGGQRHGVVVSRPRGPPVAIVHGIELGGRRLRIVAFGAHIGLQGSQLRRMRAGGYRHAHQRLVGRREDSRLQGQLTGR